MDAFYAAIEQRDNPYLKNKPVIISGNSNRSVVATASYEARQFGIGSAMPLFKAKQLCDHLEIVPGNMKKYQTASREIMKIIARFSPLLEKVSIDEAYLDISGCERLFGSFKGIALAIKKDIYNKLSLTCSIGMTPIKFLSKIASDMNKPDGLTIIEQNQVKDFIFSLPIQKVPGIGKTSMKSMQLLKINTLGDVQKFTLPLLTQKFGKMGNRLLELSNGIDKSRVETSYKRKSISSETTLSQDIIAFKEVKNILLDRSQIVGRALRKKELMCQNVFIKLKFSDFSQITRSKKLISPICSSSAIFNESLMLYKKVKLKKKIRLIGVGVSTLKDKSTPVQMLLIQDEKTDNKQWESVDFVVDSISEKFGMSSIKKASLTK
jgi:DNA polymerase IV